MYHNYFLHKIALVTGGGSGIGRELCIQLYKAGATVICTDIDPGKASKTVLLAGGNNVKIAAQKLDVSQQYEVENIIAETVREHGRIDLIFNNAGISVTGEMRDIDLADWKKITDINFNGVLYGSQIAFGYMLKQGSGQIINTASAAGLIDYLALLAPYSVTKHAVVNYTKLLRLEAKKLGVKVSVVCPSFVNTPLATNSIDRNAKQAWSENSIRIVSNGISVEKAVERILKGTKRNKEVIIFPFSGRLILLFTRVFKGLYRLIAQKLVQDYRKRYRN